MSPFLTAYGSMASSHPLRLVRKAGRALVSSPDPTHKWERGLVTFERFLGCAVSAERTRLHTVQYVLCHAIGVPCGCHMTADTAQPRKRSNVTRPFPICGWGLGTRLGARVNVPAHAHNVIRCHASASATLSLCIYMYCHCELPVRHMA